MKRFEMQIDTAHPVLFLGDSSPDMRIPEVSGSVFAEQSPDCVAFCVLPYVDGATVVTIADQPCTGGQRQFEGSINVPSGILCLSDSGAFNYLNVPVPEGPISVEIWASHNRFPDWVWVKLDEIVSL